MIANLPLLFAGGNPTTLSKMDTQELECFITFLVHCSWGHDTVKVIQQPQWWPSNVAFTNPFFRPSTVPKDWSNRLKELIKQCYLYHNSEFLLKFSEELARNPPSTLKYVDNCDRTTSLYQRISGRLLVTFRNENMLYDRKAEVAGRKCLLPKRQTASESMVEPIAVEIYLCDTCDEVFDNLKDVQNHEKSCSQRPTSPNLPPPSPEPCQKQEMAQDTFLQVFGLQAISSNVSVQSPANSQEKSENIQNPGRQRRSVLFSTLSCFPFSSLASRRINKTQYGSNTATHVRQREHIERFCAAPPLILEHPKWMHTSTRRHYAARYKKTSNYWNRHHNFHGQRGKHILDLKSQLLFLRCKPVSVKIKCLTEEEVKDIKIKLKTSNIDSGNYKNNIIDNDIEFVSVSECREPLRRVAPKCYPSKRQTTQTSLTSSFTNQNDIIIDLCSDEDENVVNLINPENIPVPVACHASRKIIVEEDLAVPATPEFQQSTEPNPKLQAAQFHLRVKKRSHFNNSQFSSSCDKTIDKQTKTQPLQEFQMNLYSSQINNSQIISID